MKIEGFIPSGREGFSMIGREFLGIVLIVCVLLLSAACGCTELSGVTENEAVHVTAILEVTVIDGSGEPVANVPVDFYSAKYTGTAMKDNSEFRFYRYTESNGKTSFTVGYNLHKGTGYPPVPETVAMTAGIQNPTMASNALITYEEASAQAGGTGAAVITKMVTLKMP
jgi:hypothetical protein